MAKVYPSQSDNSTLKDGEQISNHLYQLVTRQNNTTKYKTKSNKFALEKLRLTACTVKSRHNMKKHLIIIFLLALATTSSAQTKKEERDERIQDIHQNAAEKKIVSKLKVDNNLFRRQMLALPEYADERKKIPALRNASKMPVKIAVYVDSLGDAGDEAKTLTGYICENIGDNSTNIFEITYDRAAKKITAVKPTGETSDIEQDNDTEIRKPGVKKPAAKKNKGEDDDDDPEEDAPARKKL